MAFFSTGGNLGTRSISLNICFCRLKIYAEGFAELNRIGLGSVAAISAHCPLLNVAAVVLNLYLAAACAP